MTKRMMIIIGRPAGIFAQNWWNGPKSIDY